jgi:hypothetical protein
MALSVSGVRLKWQGQKSETTLAEDERGLSLLEETITESEIKIWERCCTRGHGILTFRVCKISTCDIP